MIIRRGPLPSWLHFVVILTCFVVILTCTACASRYVAPPAEGNATIHLYTKTLSSRGYLTEVDDQSAFPPGLFSGLEPDNSVVVTPGKHVLKIMIATSILTVPVDVPHIGSFQLVGREVSYEGNKTTVAFDLRPIVGK